MDTALADAHGLIQGGENDFAAIVAGFWSHLWYGGLATLTGYERGS